MIGLIDEVAASFAATIHMPQGLTCLLRHDDLGIGVFMIDKILDTSGICREEIDTGILA